MAKKLEANGIWESSRMMLPEHKEVILRQAMEAKRIPRPVLDDQEIALINAAIMQSKAYRKIITVTVYDAYRLRIIAGIVTRVDRTQFRLDTVDPSDASKDWEWSQFADVLKAELSKEWTDAGMIDP